MMSKQAHESVNTALDYVKKEMVNDPILTLMGIQFHRVQAARTAEPSFVSTLLEEKSQDEYLIKWAASAIAIGGSDTVSDTTQPRQKSAISLTRPCRPPRKLKRSSWR